MAQVLRGQWFMACGSILIMSTARAMYIFVIYSMDIKSMLGYTQKQFKYLLTTKNNLSSF
jgi:hypothetical protein